MKRTIIITVIMFIALFAFGQEAEWQWAEQLQGNSGDFVIAKTVDDDGNCFVTGLYGESITFGDITLTGGGVFIAEINAAGIWQWAISIDGPVDSPAISIDSYGYIYIAGSFMINIQLGPFSLEGGGLFLAKLNTSGEWQWARQATVPYIECRGISTDSYGNAYVACKFSGTAQFGIFSITAIDSDDTLVARYSHDGNCLWVEQAGPKYPNAIFTDSQGNSYVTGKFFGEAVFGSFTLESWGNCDIFVAKIGPMGSWLWAKNAGGPSDDGDGIGIGANSDNDIFITGYFEDTVAFGEFILTSYGERDIFVTKMDSQGNWLWAEQAGGSAQDTGKDICIDQYGNSFVTGLFSSTAIFGSNTISSLGNTDLFVAKIDPLGNWLWVEQAGGQIGSFFEPSITINSNGDSYVAGGFSYLVNFGPYPLSSNGDEDFFVAKLSNDVSIENELSQNFNNLLNYPNPFNPVTNISFDIKENETGTLSIYNLKGQIVESKEFTSGKHIYPWNADKRGSGLYIYQLKTDSCVETKKMLLLK